MNVLKSIITYGVSLVLAVICGYFLSTPDTLGTVLLLAAVGLTLIVPILLRWHHLLLLLSWNAFVNVFFLPGQPQLWMLMSAVSLGLSILDRTLRQRDTFLRVPSLSRPLLFLAAVVLITAFYRGGIGIRALGGASYGGKGYFYIIGAIAGFFAITARKIPLKHARWIVVLFFASGFTALMANLAYTAGPSLYFLFYFFPVELAGHQAAADYGKNMISRITGLSMACNAIFFSLLARYGIRGVLDFSRPWRPVLLFVTVVLSLFGGFRSHLVLLALIFTALFWFEGLSRAKYIAILAGCAIIVGAGLVSFASDLPLPIQRSISFLPIEIDPHVRADTAGSTEWRLDMWKILLPEIPKYLWIGKGYSIDPTDLYLTQELVIRGLLKDFEPSLITGDYHSGPLSLIIPFGLLGVAGFLWFLIAAVKVLYNNCRYGDLQLRKINCLLLSMFVARALFYFFVFGSFGSELFFFTGVVGLSISVNGGVARPPTAVPAENPQAAAPSAYCMAT